MKKNSPLLMLVFGFALLQSCGPKAEENSNATEMEASIEANAQEVRMAKREKIEAARIEKLKQRRLATIEKANASLTYKDASGKVIYNKAEVDPTYVGGDKEMMAYLRDNLTYPEIAQKNGVEGTVFVDFIVDKNGAIREVFATDVTNDEMDDSLRAEAIRVVTAMPNWVAGTQHGKAVEANYSVPITFQLSN